MTKANEWIEIRESSIHHKGGFALKDIPQGTRIIEYVGNKITKKQSDQRADEILDENKKNDTNGAVYIFTLNDKYDIDGRVSWNPAQYVNHSCDPNAQVDIIKGHIWIIALHDIKKGEEICYDYGYDLDSYEDHVCKCGSFNCVGYIVASNKWGWLRRRLEADGKVLGRHWGIKTS